MATAPKLTAIRPPAADDRAKLAELAALIQQIRDDVRSSRAAPTAPELPLPNLELLVHARDAAHFHVAAIGHVNPRPPGLANHTIQLFKRAIARTFGWFVRDQVTFNHEVIHALNATIVSLQETNQALEAALAAANTETHAWARKLQAEFRRLEDSSIAHQAASDQRQDHFELSVRSDLQAQRHELQTHRASAASAIEQSAAHLEAKSVQTARDFEQALATATDQIQNLLWTEQKKLWDAFTQTRNEYETLIHSELRLARQRSSLAETQPALTGPATTTDLHLDWLKFAEKFRGNEAHVRRTQQIYVEPFRNQAPVVDLGCGRGEFLELMQDTDTRGIEASPELVSVCRSKGLQAECSDAFTYLEACAPGSLGGVLCCQMLEHLPPADVIRLIRLAHRALRKGGLLAVETPNPESLAIFATHFYLDPSHTRPIPPALMAFHMEEAGFGALRIERLHPALESMPSLAELPADFREAFFGTLDYAAFGTKL